MTLTNEQLTEVEAFAASFLLPKEIACILQVEENDFETLAKDKTSNIAQAMQRGSLRSKAEIRKGIIQMAKQGSTPAQTMALHLETDFNIAMQSSGHTSY